MRIETDHRRHTNRETFDMALWLETRAIRTEIVDPDNNLEISRQHLANGGSLFLNTTHNHIFDMIHLMQTSADHLPNPALHSKDFLFKFPNPTKPITDLSHLTGMIALKHFGPKRGLMGSVEKFFTDEMKNLFGAGYILVVQEGDPNYEQDEANRINMSATRQAIAVLKKPGQILIIAPQGTRGKNGEMQEAAAGLATILGCAGENVLTVPVALDTNFPFEIPPITKTKVIIGKPYSYATIIQELDTEKRGRLRGNALREAVAQKMALRLAKIVRPEKRGFYASAFS